MGGGVAFRAWFLFESLRVVGFEMLKRKRLREGRRLSLTPKYGLNSSLGFMRAGAAGAPPVAATLGSCSRV